MSQYDPIPGGDPSLWAPADAAEAEAGIAAIAKYCRDVCPISQACAEERCRLYNLESRALDALGYHRNAATEAVGVIGQPVTGLPL